MLYQHNILEIKLQTFMHNNTGLQYNEYDNMKINMHVANKNCFPVVKHVFTIFRYWDKLEKKETNRLNEVVN